MAGSGCGCDDVVEVFVVVVVVRVCAIIIMGVWVRYVSHW